MRKGEGNLPKTYVANVTQIQTIDRAYLIQKIGTLPRHLLRRVWDGVRLESKRRLRRRFLPRLSAKHQKQLDLLDFAAARAPQDCIGLF